MLNMLMHGHANKLPRSLRITSLQAPNQDFMVQQLSEYLSQRLGILVEFIHQIPWQEREKLLDAGEIDIAWICGLPYIRKTATSPAKFILLAAPVPKGERYSDKPVYYSDVIVLKTSAFTTFENLQGAVWAYNEPNSHSGYNLTRWKLASMGAYKGFFGRIVEAGSHQTAIEMVLDGRVDASAIDSTVLEIEQSHQPNLAQKLRKIAILGPSPVPPMVAHARMSTKLQESVKDLLLQMHLDKTGQSCLEKTFWVRFAAVNDQDYEPIRRMASLAERVEL